MTVVHKSTIEARRERRRDSSAETLSGSQSRLTPQFLVPPAFTTKRAQPSDKLLKVHRPAPTGNIISSVSPQSSQLAFVQLEKARRGDLLVVENRYHPMCQGVVRNLWDLQELVLID